MKFNCQKEDLLYAVQAVVRAVSTKNTLPILEGIMICAKANKLSFRATDLEMAMECLVDADVLEEGTVVISGRYFYDLVKHLPFGNVYFEKTGEQLTIEYDQSHISVHCLDPDEFPALPQMEEDISGEIPIPIFRRIVRQSSIAAATDEVRPIFSGIYTQFGDNQITMVTTDTHRLALCKGGWKGKAAQTYILPTHTMQEIARLAINEEESVIVTLSKNQVFFAIGNIIVVTRVINGQYPDYKQVLPTENLFVSQCVVNRQRLIEALERAALLPRDAIRGKSNVVKLAWQKDLLTLSADVPDVGRIKEEIPISFQGKEIVSNYNAKYLLDALRVMDSENVVMRLTGDNTPGIIVPDAAYETLADAPYTYLVLPMRVRV